MPTLSRERRLILFGRYPLPGQTKTRLMPLLGPLGAAELQRQLTEHSLGVMLRSHQAPVDVAYAGGTRGQVRRWLNADRVRCYPQPEGDLGRRMQRVIQRAFDQGARQVVLVGTDVPELTPKCLADAFQALARHDLVLGPSEDGGYWLIGCRRPVPVFDGIEWGTAHVLAQTVRAAERNGLAVAQLEPLVDIDTEADVRRWRPDLALRRPYLSVVIPTLNEVDRIATIVTAVRAPAHEVIVVDGGSRDGTPQAARQAGAKVIDAPPSRARQQNAGAAEAMGEVLLFLHADTCLPRDFGARIFECLMDPRVVLGAFRFKTDYRHWAMRWVEWGVHARCVLLNMPYGDQAFFLRKSVFKQVGGFPDVPLAEDLFLVRKLVRKGRIALASGAAVTSGRRWREGGIRRVTLINYLIAGGCLLGIDPVRLAPLYQRGFKSKKVTRIRE